MASQKIDSLTSLRFFAAAAIVVYHARGHFGLPTNLLAPFELSQGVSFFFVLSGFILAYVYPRLENFAETKKFWLARFARVWPLHFATLLLAVLLIPDRACAGPGPLLANLALVHAWIPNPAFFFSFNAVSWSISTEAFFYLSFPFLIKDFARTWPYKLAFSFLLMLLMVQLSNRLHLPVTTVDSASVHGLMYINPVSRLFEFVLGLTAAHFYRRYLIMLEAPASVALAVEAVALAAVYFSSLNTVKASNWLARLPFVQEGGRMWLLHGGVPALSFVLLIAVMAWGRGPIARVLRLKALVLLGEISFAMYLLHRIFLHYYWDHFAPEQGPVPIALYAISLVLGAYCLWSIVEVPFRQLIVRGPRSLSLPRPAAALATGLALTAIGAIWIGIWSGAPLARLDATRVQALLSAPRLDAGATADADRADAAPHADKCDITFDDNLLLLGAVTRRDKRGLTATLYWKALRKQALKNNLDVRLLTENKTPISFNLYRQSQREEVVDKDDCFKNEIFVPASSLPYARSLAFTVTRPIGKAPHAKTLSPAQAGQPEAIRLSDGLVQLDLAAPLVAGKETKTAL